MLGKRQAGPLDPNFEVGTRKAAVIQHLNLTRGSRNAPASPCPDLPKHLSAIFAKDGPQSRDAQNGAENAELDKKGLGSRIGTCQNDNQQNDNHNPLEIGTIFQNDKQVKLAEPVKLKSPQDLQDQNSIRQHLAGFAPKVERELKELMVTPQDSKMVLTN